MRIFIIAICLFCSSFASACTLKKVPGSAAVVNVASINDAMFLRTLLAHTNYARCKNDFRQLIKSAALSRVANGHTIWMVENQKVSHTSTKPGHISPRDRLKKQNVYFRAAAENLASTPRMAIPQGRKVRILNERACKFRYSSGKPVPPQTYNSLSAELVRLWMNSKVHRDNLLFPRFRKMGASLKFDPKTRMCGVFYATQMFSD